MKQYGVKFKTGVVLHLLRQPIVDLLNFLAKIAKEIQTNIIITSMNDGKHREGSFHYINLAVDIRIWNLPSFRTAENLTNLIRGLHENYDVILEKNHIHVEWDDRPMPF